MPRTKARGTAKVRTGREGLTSEYAQREHAALLAMSPSQRADYNITGQIIAGGLLAGAAAVATRGAVAGPVAAARLGGALIGSAASAFAIGANAQRVIAPNLKPVVKKTAPAVRRPGAPIAR